MELTLLHNNFDADGLCALSNALLNTDNEFSKLEFILGTNYDEACKHVLQEMMMRSTAITNLILLSYPGEELNNDCKNQLSLLSHRNRLLRQYPTYKDFILNHCTKAGYYQPGNNKRSPSSLKTLAAFSFIANLDPLGVIENKLNRMPDDIKSFVYEIDFLSGQLKSNFKKDVVPNSPFGNKG